MRVVITGATGLIGSCLCKALREQGHEVIAVSTRKSAYCSEIPTVYANLMEGDIPPVMSDCDAIIHLAGAPIFHRWTTKQKQSIRDSRVKTTEAMYHFLSKQKIRPKTFLCASAVGFYGDRGDESLDETSAHGAGFLASVCFQWEAAAQQIASLGIRTVSVRTATVLSQEGGALSTMLPLFRWGLGGKLGKGTQWFPWIHREDLVSIYMHALWDTRIRGPINASAPELIRNCAFTKTLGSLVQRPTVCSVPAWLLTLCLGELGTVLLASQKVIPRLLTHLQFSFTYPTLHKALSHEVSS